MIRITFTEEKKRALKYERYNHPHPRVQQKIEVVWLKSLGLRHQDIANIAGVTANTVTTYLKEYAAGGIEKIKEVNFYQPRSKLTEHQTSLEAYFREHPPATLKEAASKIERLTGIKRSEKSVRKFLHRLGIRRRKVGMVPAKADLAAQEDFQKKELEPRLKEAKKEKRAVFFVDAAHFVFAPFLGYLWCLVRLFIKAPAGRQRFNVLSALNAVTRELITVANETYVNAQTVCELLRKIAAWRPKIPITIILDNARYQRCLLVQTLAAELGIELAFLPPYSPNLNLIERLWKFVKKQCLYSKYYEDFASFKSAISDCLEKTRSTHKTELASLLTLNFQTFKNSQIVTL